MNLTNADIKDLKDKRYRREHGLFMIEGDKFCRDLLATDIEIVYTITSNRDLKGFPNIEVVSDKMLSSLATTKTSQTIVCICRVKGYPVVSVGNSIILDRVQDPGNVGTLIRSAMAFGYSDIYLIDCADAYSEKVLRSSVGTALSARLHMVSHEDIVAHKDDIADIFMVADMLGERLGDIQLPKGRFSVIIGNEGQGVSEAMRSLANLSVSIPMSGNVESLNAGVAGSIIMQRLSE